MAAFDYVLRALPCILEYDIFSEAVVIRYQRKANRHTATFYRPAPDRALAEPGPKDRVIEVRMNDRFIARVKVYRDLPRSLNDPDSLKRFAVALKAFSLLASGAANLGRGKEESTGALHLVQVQLAKTRAHMFVIQPVHPQFADQISSFLIDDQGKISDRWNPYPKDIMEGITPSRG